jgi:hypothetical protein
MQRLTRVRVVSLQWVAVQALVGACPPAGPRKQAVEVVWVVPRIHLLLRKYAQLIARF